MWGSPECRSVRAAAGRVLDATHRPSHPPPSLIRSRAQTTEETKVASGAVGRNAKLSAGATAGRTAGSERNALAAGLSLLRGVFRTCPAGTIESGTFESEAIESEEAGSRLLDGRPRFRLTLCSRAVATCLITDPACAACLGSSLPTLPTSPTPASSGSGSGGGGLSGCDAVLGRHSLTVGSEGVGLVGGGTCASESCAPIPPAYNRIVLATIVLSAVSVAGCVLVALSVLAYGHDRVSIRDRIILGLMLATVSPPTSYFLAFSLSLSFLLSGTLIFFLLAGWMALTAFVCTVAVRGTGGVFVGQQHAAEPTGARL